MAKEHLLSATSSFTFVPQHSSNEVIPPAAVSSGAPDVASSVFPLDANDFPSSNGDSPPHAENAGAYSSKDIFPGGGPVASSTTFLTRLSSNSPATVYLSFPYPRWPAKEMIRESDTPAGDLAESITDSMAVATPVLSNSPTPEYDPLACLRRPAKEMIREGGTPADDLMECTTDLGSPSAPTRTHSILSFFKR
jgi:hypothetical protein